MTHIALVVDFAAIHFGDQSADHGPRDGLGADVCTAVSDRVDPGVDYEAAAFIL